MKLKKEDYMRLPKERLAELLVERDAMENPIVVPSITPYIPEYPRRWWEEVTYE